MCSLCRRPARRLTPTDGDRRFWLEVFSDEEICEIAHWMFDKPGDIETCRSWRSVLLPKEKVTALTA